MLCCQFITRCELWDRLYKTSWTFALLVPRTQMSRAKTCLTGGLVCAVVLLRSAVICGNVYIKRPQRIHCPFNEKNLSGHECGHRVMCMCFLISSLYVVKCGTVYINVLNLCTVVSSNTTVSRKNVFNRGAGLRSSTITKCCDLWDRLYKTSRKDPWSIPWEASQRTRMRSSCNVYLFSTNFTIRCEL